VPELLRWLLGQLVGAPPEQVVLGNSTSYGLHLIANGLDWRDGDEVLVLEGDYPATVLPWRRLERRGFETRALRATGPTLSAEELAAAISERTRLLAVTWVDSFTGSALDLDAFGAVCTRAGVLLVVNASQALGARHLDVDRAIFEAQAEHRVDLLRLVEAAGDPHDPDRVDVGHSFPPIALSIRSQAAVHATPRTEMPMRHERLALVTK
jgi:cysteine sulfinate desulfinase/cysteine desulfurase-like protein